MADASLITPELEALLGRAFEREPVEVTLALVHHAMDVYGDARLPFAPGDEVPDYVLLAMTPPAERGQLMPRAQPAQLVVSNGWRFERPLRLGDRLTCRVRLGSLSERFGGHFGHSLQYRTDAEFRGSTGALVATDAITFIQYDPANATPEPAP